MKTEWSNLLADLKAKRDELTQAIATIEKHFAIPDGETSAPRRCRKTSPKSRRAVKAEGPRAAASPDALPDDAEFEKRAARLLAVLDSSPQRVGDAIKAAKLTFPSSGHQSRFLTKLAAAGRVVRAGTARGATLARPGTARRHL